jgi:hypothetical protein
MRYGNMRSIHVTTAGDRKQRHRKESESRSAKLGTGKSKRKEQQKGRVGMGEARESNNDEFWLSNRGDREENPDRDKS